ncbi:hypothetical protein [Hyalangium rubrum]|uniref:DUF2092 domain-containing protein n=1 Tax=Hyalangium rubrum TaxID=3103134 RepID=A0ABU5H914_9BACT|nr:hypothetical protein [Hyalangium sp. s54d21]MDY7229257.1 hypothetical protein [Hyalangium sp. s54d21]
MSATTPKPAPVILVLVGVLTSMAAGAYVLPGGSILRRMTGSRDDAPQVSSLRVEGSYVFSGSAVKEASAALGLATERSELVADGLILMKMPARCRFDVSVPDGNKLAVVQVAGRRRVEGTEIPSLSTALSQLCPLLATRSTSEGDARDLVEQHLQSLGIATRTTSLARFGGEVAYVLGEPDEAKPQFWVYKDDFRPARVRWTDKAGTAWDVRFIDYASPATGEGMPRSLEVWRGGERVLRFTAIKSDSRASIPDKLFVPEATGR